MNAPCSTTFYRRVAGIPRVQSSCGKPAAGIWEVWVVGASGRALSRRYAYCAACHRRGERETPREWHERRADKEGVPRPRWIPIGDTSGTTSGAALDRAMGE